MEEETTPVFIALKILKLVLVNTQKENEKARYKLRLRQRKVGDKEKRFFGLVLRIVTKQCWSTLKKNFKIEKCQNNQKDSLRNI